MGSIMIRQCICFCVFLLSSTYAVSTELEQASKYGRLLTEAVKSKSHIKYKKLPQYKDIKAFLGEQKCPSVKYKAYIVGPTEQQYFYLVASKGRNVILGRHFKAPINDGVIDISAFESSTKGCLNLGSVKEQMVAMSASHLKPYPNEFHVLKSNVHAIPFYIVTSKGYFKIEDSLVELVKERETVLSDDAPVDKPVSLTNQEQLEAFYKALEPYTKEALQTYPQAKERYLNGLPKGENFFLTTRLHDEQGRVEQVFILVESIKGSMVSGVISNEIRTVSGFQNGQRYEFPESEIYDWLIAKPDGSEEGNYVGKYLDTLH